jgi:phytol kinase
VIGEGGAVLGVSAACASVLVLGETLHRVFGVEPERTRKLVHVLMGLVATSFPWVFGDPRPVVLVCSVFAAILGASLLSSRLPSVHQVDRRTAGALWFPLAVAAVFVGARGRPELYATSMLVLTFADPAAALVGRTCGAHRYRSGRDAKSVEGSLAFLAVASAILFVALDLTTPLGTTASLGWALTIGILLAGVEAVAPAGSDNILVPAGALLLLRAADPGGTAAELAALAFLAVVAAVGLAAHYRVPPERARA